MGTLQVSTPDRPLLMDEPARIVITGAPAGAEVRVDAQFDMDGTTFVAEARYFADADGTVDPTRDASYAGSYTGVDPFGLWWSATPAGAAGATAPGGIATRVSVTADDQHTEAVLQRTWLAPGCTMTPMEGDGFRGLFARPAGDGPFPAVIAFGGSSGGFGPAAAWAPTLAAHGFAVLAVAYFGMPGLPQGLVEVELEVAQRALDWLRARSDVRADALASMGQSRGSEFALWAAALNEGVGAAVTIAPSGISWSAIDANGPTPAPAWLHRGEAVPYARMDPATIAEEWGLRPTATGSEAVPLRGIFEYALAHLDLTEAEIPIERSTGPIMLISGEADLMWPSTPMSEVVERRAKDTGFAREVVHLLYPEAGHVCAGPPAAPVFVETKHPLTGERYTFGGTRASNAQARADSWPKIIDFLRTALR